MAAAVCKKAGAKSVTITAVFEIGATISGTRYDTITATATMVRTMEARLPPKLYSWIVPRPATSRKMK